MSGGLLGDSEGRSLAGEGALLTRFKALRKGGKFFCGECSASSSLMCGLISIIRILLKKRKAQDLHFRVVKSSSVYFGMEVLVSTVTNAVLSALFRSLYDTLSSPDFLKFTRDKQVVAEIEKWQKFLQMIDAVLEDAEEKQITSRPIQHWLRDLQDFAFDADDVIDELATEALRRKLLMEQTQPSASTSKIYKFFLPSCFGRKLLMEQTQPSASTSKIYKFFLPSCFGAIDATTIKFDANIKPKIKKVTARLNTLARQKNLLNLVKIGEERSEKVLRRLPTSSLVDESCIYGRDGDKNAIVELLMDGGETGKAEYGVVPIVGLGGVGKTTLAQLVYNDVRIRNSFELRAWVCVSEEFDVIRVTKNLLQAFASETSKLEDLNLLQVELKKKLSRKKFLIVLDDIWNENYEHWDVLCRPFTVGAAGSKIVVTTRNEGVAAVVANHAAYRLKELSYDDCVSLFTWHALRARNFEGHPHLKVTGEQIIKRCKGLPLAVKTLAGLLRTKVDQDEWEKILISKMWDLPEEKSGIIPALRLSYHHLPSYLRRCFAYCSVFPKDYEFDKNELILLWMAEGFLQRPGKIHMEDLGLEYFNELLSRSFFQQSNSNKTQFVMHDLINDLARYVSQDLCFNFEDMVKCANSYTNVEKIRHTAFAREQYDIRERFEILNQMKKLRTLTALPICMPRWAACCHISGDVLENILPRLGCLRVLSLSGYSINELPNSIGHLKHLRYLNLSHCGIRWLPQSVGSLFNLQTLLLRGCMELTKLPHVIHNLVNLRVLDLTDTSNLLEMPCKIGKLKDLQILSKFIVGEGMGSAVKELGGLLHLRGELSIMGLENVSDIQDASDANLKDKHGLTALNLQWRCDSEDQDGVLENLRPQKNLEELRILFYGGKTFPSWLADPSLINIVCLELRNCRKITSLPSLGRLPSLKELFIIGMDGVHKVDFEFYGHGFPSVKPFPSLEILHFKDMLELTCWSSPGQPSADSGEEFPCLCELIVENCPKLSKKLPSRLLSLVKLVIKHCPKLEGSSMSFPSLCELFVEDCNEELLRSILGLSSLTTLTAKSIPVLHHLQNGVVQFQGALRDLVISNCNGLTSLWQKDDTLSNIASLEHLKIKGCSRFMSLAENEQVSSINFESKPPWGMHGFTSLVGLQIESCPNLVFFPNAGFLPMIKHLKLKDCLALKSLPWEIHDWPLEGLEIEDCPALTCFPSGGSPTKLRRLRIGYCKNLSNLPEGLMQIDNSTSNLCHLEKLEIISCPSLRSFPIGKLPATLKVLKIWNCANLEPLSDKMLHKNASLEFIFISKWMTMTILPECVFNLSHLIELNLSECPLEYFPEELRLPSLRKFDISNCINLKSLPDQIRRLTSLQFLTICDCPGLVSFPGLPPNLLVLVVWDCENLKQPMSEWNLQALSSLRELTIAGAPDTDSFPDENCLLPTTLVSLFLGELQNLQCLSRGIHSLTLLEELEIANCPKLRCLPKEGLPAKLGRLCIRDCELLTQQCLKGKGAYWPVIAHIPFLEIEN